MQHLILHFPFTFHPTNLSALRAALVEIAGLDQSLFHNHLPAEEGAPRWSWDYPLIQYGMDQGRPVVRALGQGAQAVLTYLLPQLPDYLVLQGRQYPMTGYRLQSSEVMMPVVDNPTRFGLVQWIALNAANYVAWKQADGDENAQRDILERALRGHLAVMARTLHPDEAALAMEAKLVSVDRVKRIHWHGIDLVAFHIVAESRILPPKGLGVGRCVAYGFGSVFGPSTYYKRLGVKHSKRQPESSLTKG